MNNRNKNKIGGYIAYYHLEDWWLASFTEEERILIDKRYQPIGAGAHSLTRGRITFSSGKLDTFLNSLETWFRSEQDGSIAKRIRAKIEEVGHSHPIDAPGYINGRHYTTFVEDVKFLKRAGRVEEAQTLLDDLVDATEAQSKSEGGGVAPWYYEQLAVIYRQQKDYEQEVAILERFARQEHAQGATPSKLLERLKNAKKKLSAST